MTDTTIPPGVTVFCDPTLKHAMRGADELARAQFGAPLGVLSAPAPLMLAQLARHTRDDVLFTLSAAMDDAITQNRMRPSTRLDGWRNSLVLAGLGGTAPADKAALIALVMKSRIAVTDNTVASGLDGRAVLDANGLLAPAGSRVMGTANTGDAAFLVATGVADLGLIYLTDARANPRLTVMATLDPGPAALNYSIAVSAKSISPNAQNFLSLLKSPAGATLLQNAGLGVPA